MNGALNRARLCPLDLADQLPLIKGMTDTSRGSFEQWRRTGLHAVGRQHIRHQGNAAHGHG